MLFLGTSEGIGEFGELFAVLDRKAKLYQRKEDFAGTQRAMLVRALSPMSPATAIGAALPRFAGRASFPEKLPLRELTEQALLQQIAPAGALVNGQGDILYLHGRTGMYLEPAPGEAGINNILKMAREGLRPGLTAALHKAAVTREPVRTPALRVKTNGHFTRVNLSIRPVISGTALQAEPPETPETRLYLVILEEAPTPEPVEQAGVPLPAGSIGATHAEASPDASNLAAAQARIVALTEELRAKDEYLQSTHEELESSNEELKSSNEEMQSVNEELQSTNEELETSKEELQSVNEELATVNTELHTKVLDLSRANNDMNNLLAGTGIATVFVDHQRRILRFTPAAARDHQPDSGRCGATRGPHRFEPGGLHHHGGGRTGRTGHTGHPGSRAADHGGQVVCDAHPALPHAGQRDRGCGVDLHGHYRDEAHRSLAGGRQPAASPGGGGARCL